MESSNPPFFLVLSLLCVLLPSARALTSPSESQVFFELHQAVGYLESFKTGRCPTALLRVESHLVKLSAAQKQGVSPLFGGLIGRLQRLKMNIQSEGLDSVERLRSELHRLGEQRGWDHAAQWHQDFRSCSP